MISDKMSAAITKQVNAELYSAYLYFAMSSHSSYKGLAGIAQWLAAQAMEETTHARKLYDYLKSQGRHVVLGAIDKPESEWDSPKAVFKQVLEHEQHVTSLINALVNQAVEEKDHATQGFLQWFVAEQVEEEDSAMDVLSKFELAGDHVGALFMLDKELGTRVFTGGDEAEAG